MNTHIKYMHISLYSATVAGLVMLASLGCKPPKKSETNTIDNIARGSGSYAVHECKKDQDAIGLYKDLEGKQTLVDSWYETKVEASPEIKAEHEAKIKELLMVLPSVVGVAFFDSGKIYLSETELLHCEEDAKQRFREQGNDQNNIKLIACHGDRGVSLRAGPIQVGGSAQRTLSLGQSIDHALLHAIFWRYAEGIDVLASSEIPQVDDVVAKNVATFESHKEFLVESLNADLQRQAAEGGSSTELDTNDSYLRIATFVESYESLYCNLETHNLFAYCFPQTYLAFRYGSTNLESLNAAHGEEIEFKAEECKARLNARTL